MASISTWHRSSERLQNAERMNPNLREAKRVVWSSPKGLKLLSYCRLSRFFFCRIWKENSQIERPLLCSFSPLIGSKLWVKPRSPQVNIFEVWMQFMYINGNIPLLMLINFSALSWVVLIRTLIFLFAFVKDYKLLLTLNYRVLSAGTRSASVRSRRDSVLRI